MSENVDSPTPASPALARWRSPSARAQLLLSAVLFGLVAVFARMAALRGFSPGQLAVLRFAAGTLALGAYFVRKPRALDLHYKGVLLVRGLFGGAAVLLYFVALARIPAGEATLLNNLHPMFTTLLAIGIIRERPTPHLWAALGLATTGVLLVLGGGAVRLELGMGELAGLGSAVLGGAAVLAIRVLRRPGPTGLSTNAATIFFAFSVVGLAMSSPLALEAWPAGTLAAWAPAVTAAILTVGAQLLMTEALGFLPIPEASVWQQLTPVMSYLWAAVILGEPMGAAALAGVAVTVAGVSYAATLGVRAAANGAPGGHSSMPALKPALQASRPAEGPRMRSPEAKR